MTETRLLLGDCVEKMHELDAASVHAVVCDPPYGLEFMGKDWDRLGDNGFRRSENPADVGRDDVFGRTSARGPEYRAGHAMQEWHEAWAVEALRVLKPGGFLLAFGGTRTYHRLACAVEDAGFEIRDRFWTSGGEVAGELAWMFGSGFPKSLDVSKAIDKAAGVERTEVIGVKPGHEDFVDRTDAHASGGRSDGWERPWRDDDEAVARSHQALAPVTPEAEQWQGWQTALKPAHEPILVARKPLVGTVAANVLAYGTGAINVDACRVGFAGTEDERESKTKNAHGDFGTQHGGNEVYGDYTMLGERDNYDPPGRWPANVILLHLEGCVQVGERTVASDGHYPATRPGATEITTVGHGGQESLPESHTRGETQEVWECAAGCPVAELDAQTGDLGVSAGGRINKAPGINDSVYGGGWQDAVPGDPGFGDRGGASRFFYCAKVSRAERNAGLDAFEKRPLNWSSGDQNPGSFQAEGTEKAARNAHPTVKPISLMRWLIRLVCPPAGVILDPFLGSGSTGCAAVLEDCVGTFIGIERDPDYMRIAEARIAFWSEYGERGLELVREREQGERVRREREASGQLDMFATGGTE